MASTPRWMRRLFDQHDSDSTETELLRRQGEVIEQIHQTLMRTEEINRELVEVLQKTGRRPVVLNATGNFIGSAVLAIIVLVLTTRSKWTSWLNTQIDKIGQASATPAIETVASVANVLLFIGGAISVIMINIGGLRYVTSAGDQVAVTAAKNTILYAMLGVVSSFLLYAGIQYIANR